MGGTTTPFLRGVRIGFFWVRFGRKNEPTTEAKFRTFRKNVENPDISARLIFDEILVSHKDEVTSGGDFDFGPQTPILPKFHKNSPLSESVGKRYTRFDLEAQISAKWSSNNVILY